MKISKRQLKKIIRESMRGPGAEMAAAEAESRGGGMRKTSLDLSFDLGYDDYYAGYDYPRNPGSIKYMAGWKKAKQEEEPHPRGDLGTSTADVKFPILVRYEDESEIAYNEQELDNILDDIVPRGVKYSLDSLEDVEAVDLPAGSAIETYAEVYKPRDLHEINMAGWDKAIQRMGRRAAKQHMQSLFEADDEDYQAVVDNIIVKFYEKAHDFEQYQPLSIDELTNEEMEVVEFFQPPEFKPLELSSHMILDLNDELQADVEDYTLGSIGENVRRSRRLCEGTMIVQRKPYGGMSVEVDGEEKMIGDMVADLLDAGDDDIFDGPQGRDNRALNMLINSWSEGRGGDMLNWDADIFPNNYNVDLDRVIRLWARRYNHNIEELEMEEW